MPCQLTVVLLFAEFCMCCQEIKQFLGVGAGTERVGDLEVKDQDSNP